MGSGRSAFWRIAVCAARRHFGEGLGRWALAAYVPAFVIANPLIAWPILARPAGLLFGTAAGTPLAPAGVTLAALTQMAIARFLAGAVAAGRGAVAA